MLEKFHCLGVRPPAPFSRVSDDREAPLKNVLLPAAVALKLHSDKFAATGRDLARTRTAPKETPGASAARGRGLKLTCAEHTRGAVTTRGPPHAAETACAFRRRAQRHLRRRHASGRRG